MTAAVDTSILRKVSHNTLYSYAMLLWVSLLGFLITPFILRFLGNELYGIWGVALSAFGTATFFDLGVGTALVLYVADARIRERPNELYAIINSSLTVYLVFGLVAGFLLAAGGRQIVYRLLKVSPEFQGLAASILLIYGILFAIQMPAQIYENVLYGMQRLDVTNKTGICVRTFERLLVLVLLMKRVDFRLVVCASGLASLTLYLILFVFVKRLLPGYRPRLRTRREDLRKLVSTGSQQFIAHIGYILLGVVDRFLIGSLLHVSIVTFYDLASRPSQFISQLGAKFFLPVYPASAELKSLGEKEKLRRLLKSGTKIVLTFLVPLALPIFLWSNEIIHFWVGPGYGLAGKMLHLLTVTYFVLGVNAVPTAVMYGLNKAWIVTFENTLRVVLNVVLSYLLILRVGGLGAAYGLMIASLLTTALFFGIKAKVLGIGKRELFCDLLLFPLVFLILGVVIFSVRPFSIISTVLRFLTFTGFFLWASVVCYIGRNEMASLLRSVFSRSEGEAEKSS